MKILKTDIKKWIEEALRIDRHVRDRDSKWARSITAGGKEFVEMTKDRLAYRAGG